MAHKTLIYIGDLERYQETYASTTATTASTTIDYAGAAVWYKLASQLMPVRGNPHNQLAVLSQMQIGGDFTAIYRYVLSLLVAEPFMTAKENLALLLKKSIGVVDKRDAATTTAAAAVDEAEDEDARVEKLVQQVRAVSTWSQLQTYVMYVLGVLYHPNCRGRARYHGVLRKLQPVILDALRKLLLEHDDDIAGAHTHEQEDEDDDAKKTTAAAAVAVASDEEEDTAAAVIITRLCVMSIFIVIDTFDAKQNYVGYKQAIAWTLSLVAAMMQWCSTSSGGGAGGRMWLLRPITLCCLWLQRNFEFAIPDIDKSPWLSMQIDQTDLRPNNAFFAQFARLLNFLQTRYANSNMEHDDAGDAEDGSANELLPEQLEFYGVKTLRLMDVDDEDVTRYREHAHCVFIYHRRFALKREAFGKLYGDTQVKTKKTTTTSELLHCARYRKLRQFARFSAHKIEGVLVCQENAWIANNLQLTDDTPDNVPLPQAQPQHNGYHHHQHQQQQQQQQHYHQPQPQPQPQRHSAKTPSPPTTNSTTPQSLPVLPIQQKSSDSYCSPMYPIAHRHYPSHPHQHHYAGGYNNHAQAPQPPPLPLPQALAPPAQPHAGYRVPPAHRYANCSKSAPASPRGLSSRPHSHSHQYHGPPPPPHGHRPYMFNSHAPPLMEDYTEDNQYTTATTTATATAAAATAAAAYEYRHAQHNHNHQQQQTHSARSGQHQSTPTSPVANNHHHQQSPSRYSSTTAANNNHHHHHHQQQQHNHANKARYNYTYCASANAASTAAAAAGDATAFSFNTAAAAASYGTPSNHAIQPVTQPTTPVFTAHRTPASNSYSHLHSFTRSNNLHPASSLSSQQQQQHQLHVHTPNHNSMFGMVQDPSSPLLCEDIVTEIFEELHLAQQ